MLAPNSVGLLNDFTAALGQQLYFWGRDVLHQDGNLLCEYGLERYKADGVKGSSSYRIQYKDDLIELHRVCVGRYSNSHPSFLYTRKYGRCWIYDDATPPFPGRYDKTRLKKNPFEQLELAGRRFLEWWLEYEAWIATRTSPGYRRQCYRSYRKLPDSRSWLKPADAIMWLQQYMDSPASLKRAKKWKRNSVSMDRGGP